MNLNTKTWVVIGSLIAYSIFVYTSYTRIAEFMATSSLIAALIAYIIFNPAYLFVFYGIWQKFSGRKMWKKVVASVLVILSLDFLAVPRLGVNQSLTDGPAVATNIGSVVMRALEHSMSHEFAYFGMYLLFPIIGLIVAVELLGITNFIREVR